MGVFYAYPTVYEKNHISRMDRDGVNGDILGIYEYVYIYTVATNIVDIVGIGTQHLLVLNE